MDDKDLQIIAILERNSRTPYTEIAKELGVTEGTVRNRVDKLEVDGIIKNFTVEVDPYRMGFRHVTILGLDCEPQNILTAVEELSTYDEVRWAATSSGDHMIMCEIWTRDGRELSRLMTARIAKIEGVKKLCPAMILEKIK